MCCMFYHPLMPGLQKIAFEGGATKVDTTADFDSGQAGIRIFVGDWWELIPFSYLEQCMETDNYQALHKNIEHVLEEGYKQWMNKEYRRCLP